MKVAIQGIKGSFHHIVAEQYFGKNIDLIECLSFTEMPNLLHTKQAEVVIMAIENSIAGAILPNYALIDEHQLTICGEHHLPIHHHLMGVEGQDISEIQEVYSHPMALLQCHHFFKAYPHIKLIEDKDTAVVAKRIKDGKLKGVGAIASELAAATYELEIIAAEIQTIKQNATRFFILTNSAIKNSVSANKASIKFITSHESGSLANVLTILAKHHLNLSKIQSMPVIDTPWKYAFFADFTFDSYADYYNAIQEVTAKVETLKVLGEYTKGKR
ncbi:MAG: prephenate dehydratase [Lutibacter sp.]|uniref:prephenate dehydratase n=1 Tax=Lutibacter sp. TaxID=1925666 RepID=UPI00183D313C|nr:prephenate dehydratase [Lutibacter sp.]MBT8318395.1 prephenate dehydratase [Lutibacter sp.]NNJ59253.1 prephenate dehydratase [Lutibacter sp.]